MQPNINNNQDDENTPLYRPTTDYLAILRTVQQSLQDNQNSIIYRLFCDTLFTEYTANKLFPQSAFARKLNQFVEGYGFVAKNIWSPIAASLLMIDWLLPQTQMAFSATLGPYLYEEASYWLWPTTLTVGLVGAGFAETVLAKPPHQGFIKDWVMDINKENKLTSAVCGTLATLRLILTVYSQINFIQLWVNKINNNLQHQKDVDTCRESNRMYVYMADYGNYECALCPDWNFIEPSRVFSAQDCLNGLMRKVKEPNDVLSYMDRIIQHSDFTRVDLSTIDWSRWNLKEFKTYVEKIAKATKKLDELNLSKSASNNNYVDDGKLEYLFKKFLKKVKVDTLNVNHWQMGSSLANTLMNGVANAEVKALYAAGNDFGDDGIDTMVNSFNVTALSVLDVSFNRFSNNALEKIRTHQPDTLLSLMVAGNQINNKQACDFVKHMAGKSLQYLGVGYNQLTGAGVVCLVHESAQSNITGIDFSGNLLGNTDLPNIQIELNQTNIRLIKLANIKADRDAIITFLNHLDDEGSYSIDLSENLLGNKFIEELKGIIKKHPNKFTTLYLNNMQLNDNVLDIIKELKHNSTLRYLYLNNNLFSKQLGVNLVPELLTPSPSKKIMGARRISQYDAQQLQKLMPSKNLKKLSLFGPPLNNASQWSLERLHGIDVDYSSNRGIDSPSNISSSVYLGFAFAPYITPLALTLLFLCVAIRIGCRVHQQRSINHTTFGL